MAFISLNVTRECASFRRRNSSEIDLDISSDAVTMTGASGVVVAATDVVVSLGDVVIVPVAVVVVPSLSWSWNRNPSDTKNSLTDDAAFSNNNNCSKMRSKQSKKRCNVMVLTPMATDGTDPGFNAT